MKRVTYYATREHLVSSVRVEHLGGHARVTIWNRGTNAGTLTVEYDDGVQLANALIPEPTSVEADD